MYPCRRLQRKARCESRTFARTREHDPGRNDVAFEAKRLRCALVIRQQYRGGRLREDRTMYDRWAGGLGGTAALAHAEDGHATPPQLFGEVVVVTHRLHDPARIPEAQRMVRVARAGAMQERHHRKGTKRCPPSRELSLERRAVCRREAQDALVERHRPLGAERRRSSDREQHNE